MGYHISYFSPGCVKMLDKNSVREKVIFFLTCGLRSKVQCDRKVMIATLCGSWSHCAKKQSKTNAPARLKVSIFPSH